MTETIPELDSNVQTVNGFCADLVEKSETSSITLDDLRRRIDEHRETHDDPGRMLMALSVACGYTTRTSQPGAEAALAFGDWVPGWIDVEPDSMLVCPPPLGRVDSAIRDRWAELARATALHPLLRARLADLLSTLGHGPSCEFEQIAVQEYLEALADRAVHPRERTTALRRLTHLCDELQDPRLVQIIEHRDLSAYARRHSQSPESKAPAAA